MNNSDFPAILIIFLTFYSNRLASQIFDLEIAFSALYRKKDFLSLSSGLYFHHGISFGIRDLHTGLGTFFKFSDHKSHLIGKIILRNLIIIPTGRIVLGRSITGRE